MLRSANVPFPLYWLEQPSLKMVIFLYFYWSKGLLQILHSRLCKGVHSVVVVDFVLSDEDHAVTSKLTGKGWTVKANHWMDSDGVLAPMS